jgi:hypothetical protein
MKKKYNIKKMNEYMEILKDDEDWDWHFIIKLLIYKLQRTRKCILKNNIVISSEIISNEIKEVEELLKRVIEDKYHEFVLEEYYEKYGRQDLLKSFVKMKNGNFRYKSEFTDETPEIINKKNEYFFLTQIASEMKTDDLNKAFELMAKNIRNWWD